MKNRMDTRLRRNARPGFSLIEITLVVLIIGVLAAAAAFSLVGIGERNRIRATIANMETIRTAINMYHAHHNGQYPASLDALMAGRTPYLDPDKGIQDAWGREFLYSVPGTSRPFDLVSMGSDGVYGTEDDIDLWNLPRD